MAPRCPIEAYDIRCSTEGSTGVVLSDLRNVDRPGACVVAPCAILRVCSTSGLVESFLSFERPSMWGRGAVARYCHSDILVVMSYSVFELERDMLTQVFLCRVKSVEWTCRIIEV
jgi:hypothetical protein